MFIFCKTMLSKITGWRKRASCNPSPIQDWWHVTQEPRSDTSRRYFCPQYQSSYTELALVRKFWFCVQSEKNIRLFAGNKKTRHSCSKQRIEGRKQQPRQIELNTCRLTSIWFCIGNNEQEIETVTTQKAVFARLVYLQSERWKHFPRSRYIHIPSRSFILDRGITSSLVRKC
jgi:hypothetical protein